MESNRDVFDNIWTDVTIKRVVVDRGKVIEVATNIRQQEVEAEQRALIKQSDEEVAESFTLDNSSFQAGVMRAVRGMFDTPVQVAAQNSNELRFLPPSAIKEVTVTINNLGSVIVA